MQILFKSIIVILIMGVTPPATFAQSYSDLKEKPYRAWSYSMEGRSITQGYLLHHSDSIIVLKDLSFQNEIFLPLRKVQYLRFRRKGSGGRGTLWGALAGLGLGVISGFAAGDDTPPNASNCADFACVIATGLTPTLSAEDKAILGGFSGLGIGAGLGALLGSSRTSPLYLFGNPAVYEQNKGELLKYTLKF